jgi:hypothetical protein
MTTNAHVAAPSEATANLNLNDEVRMTNGTGVASPDAKVRAGQVIVGQSPSSLVKLCQTLEFFCAAPAVKPGSNTMNYDDLRRYPMIYDDIRQINKKIIFNHETHQAHEELRTEILKKSQ